MSESSDQQEAHRAKKRPRKRSCDVCRSKKIRCDGPEKKSHEKCTNCLETGSPCTYVEMAKRRGPPKGYVEQLEQRMLRLEATLKRLHPDVDFAATVGPVIDKDSFDLRTHLSSLQGMHIPPLPALNLPKTSGSSSRAFANSPTSHTASPASASTPPSTTGRLQPFTMGAPDWTARESDSYRRTPQAKSQSGGFETPSCMSQSDSDEHDTKEQAKMVADFAKLQTTEEHKEDHYRYHGKSSGVQLVQAVRDLKKDAAGGADGFVEGLAKSRRRQYWTIPAWEIGIANEAVTPPNFALWPEPDLAQQLIAAYFRHCNVEYPLLNRIIFEKQYSDGLWRHHWDFTKVVLMVFANGARFVDDERAYFKVSSAENNESSDGTARHSAGWKYMQAVIKMGKSWLAKPGLHDLQAHVLFCTFMQGSAIPHMTWLIAGMGLRLSQDMGIHLRAGTSYMGPVDRALYSRAFWCLYHIDRVSAAAIGRAVAMQDSDFDAEFPVAVDDEYWDTGDPETCFVQPPGTVAKIQSFICMLRLDHIIECALKTVYAVGKSNMAARVQDSETQRAIVVELDSSLNAWADAVPDILRWDPSRQDIEWLERSAVLYSHYYFCQILVHRPFIPTPRRPACAGFPSLAICSNASRAISNILDVVLRRGRQASPVPGTCVPVALLMPAFTAAVVLLIGVWGGRKPGGTADSERAMQDVKKCLRGMKEMESTWRQAGKIADILNELASASNMPVATPPSSGAAGWGSSALKRAREHDHAGSGQILHSGTDAQSTRVEGLDAAPSTSPQSLHSSGVDMSAGASFGNQPYGNAPPIFDNIASSSFPFTFTLPSAPNPVGFSLNQDIPQRGSHDVVFDSPLINNLFGSLSNPGSGTLLADMDASSMLLHGYGSADLDGSNFMWPGLFDVPDSNQPEVHTLEGWAAYGSNGGSNSNSNRWDFNAQM